MKRIARCSAHGSIILIRLLFVPIIVPVGAFILLEHSHLARPTILMPALQLLQVGIVGIHHWVVEDDARITTQMVVQHQRLSIVARQLSVYGVILGESLDKLVEIFINKVRAQLIVAPFLDH